MADEGYNGYTNFETWVTGLWLDNDYGSYRAVADLAEEAVTDWVENGGREAEGTLADQLKEMVEEANPLEDADASLFTDLLRAALSEVNWYELAAGYCETAREALADA